MKKSYTAVTGDIVKSRQLPNRQNVQACLEKTLTNINRKYRQEITVKFSVILGDEFQGLLSSPRLSYSIAREIQQALYPVRVSFGIGEGPLSTKILSKTSQMDGLCLVRSRQALLLAKGNSWGTIVYQTDKEQLDQIINTIVMLIDAIKKDWKKIHYRRVGLYEKLKTMKAVAQKERVSVQMISKMFQDISLEKIKIAEESIRFLLNPIWLKSINQPYRVEKH